MRIRTLSIILFYSLFGMASCHGKPIPPQANSPIPMTSDLEKYLHKLSSEHGHDRRSAIQWLSEHPEESRPALHDLLRTGTSSWTEQGALMALVQMPDASDLPLLDSLAATSSNHFWVMQAIAAIPDAKAFDLLSNFAAQENQEKAGNAIVALGSSADPRSRALLEEMTANASAYVRWKAVHGLSVMGVSESKTVLEKRLAVETDEEVKGKLREVLGE